MPGTPARLAPLTFRPILMEKVWGGRRLARYGKHLPESAPIGESWEIADLDSTSASGAGGGAARSVVASGYFAGRTLREVIAELGDDLIDPALLEGGERFPLLIKFLDARENLSVQVHPSPEYAQANPGAHLKTESWYIVEADPGAVIYSGVGKGVTRESFHQHIEAGTAHYDMIESRAQPGSCHTLPSGTCHALGAGVLVAEVQTPSDTTFRVYDWGRTGRELHLKQALECIDYGPAPEPFRLGDLSGRSTLAETPFYTIEGLRLDASSERISAARECVVLMGVAGEAFVRSRSGSFAPTPLHAGTTLLIPAAIAQDAAVQSDSSATVLRIVPRREG